MTLEVGKLYRVKTATKLPKLSKVVVNDFALKLSVELQENDLILFLGTKIIDHHKHMLALCPNGEICCWYSDSLFMTYIDSYLEDAKNNGT